MTRVSIITPTYNNILPDYSKSRESLDSQTCGDFEWIVVDDGSDNFFHTPYDIRLDKNYGASVARNAGFQIASGDIITYLDMGDELALDRVANLISLFDQYKLELLFCAYDMVQNGQRYRFDHFNFLGKNPYPTAFDYVQLLQKQNISIPLGVAHTRRPFVQAGGFQRGIVCGEDGILWRRMLKFIEPDKSMFSDSVAGTYYISENGQSRTQRRPEMGGFAFDGSKNDNGTYLDKEWFETFSSEGHYE